MSESTGDLIQFGIGDGSSTAFKMGLIDPMPDLRLQAIIVGSGSTGQVPVGYLSAPSVYKTDWQGTYKLSYSARTNYAFYSNTLSNAYWTKSGTTIDASTYLGPSGATNANKILETSASSAHSVQKASMVGLSLGAPTVSFADGAPGERTWLRFASDGGNAVAFFDLANGIVGSVTGCTATISPLLNGFYRCAVFYTPATSVTIIWGMSTNGSVSSYPGDITKGLFITNLNSYPGTTLQPHIPTTTAAASVTDYSIDEFGLVTLASALGDGETLYFSGLPNVYTWTPSTGVVAQLAYTSVGNVVTFAAPPAAGVPLYRKWFDSTGRVL